MLLTVTNYQLYSSLEDLCVMSQLGWIDQDGQPINQTMTEDVMSLPQEVSAHLSEETVGECAMDMVTQWAEDPEHAKCANKYTQKEVEILTEVGVMMASYKCFQYFFNQACKGMVQSQIYQLYSSTATVPSVTIEKEADRTFQSASCYSTCAAASFASTTTCTFGFFFKFTRTCNQVFPVLALLASG